MKSMEILEKMSRPLELSDRESLLKSASTSLNSKVGYSFSLIELKANKAYSEVNDLEPGKTWELGKYSA